MHIIETDELSRRYGARRGIERVSVGVPEGSLFGFLGPNGAGKTTAIRVMLGLLRPSSGSARICGLDCWKDSKRVKAHVGYVPGDLRLYPWLTGHSAMRLVGGARGMDVTAIARDLAGRFDLDLGVPVRRMSRGMRQKLGLIMALAPEPRLLILDEPTGALDPLMQDRLQEHLRALAAKGHTVFFSSHTLSEVESLCDRIAIVRDGRIVANSTLAELRSHAEREVSIRWKSGAVPPEPPTSLLVTRRSGRLWSGRCRGDAEPLLAWIRDLPVEDITIAPPNLESLFRRFYEGEAAP
jgi:ABC-2 type transport system ATP-binding protein